MLSYADLAAIRAGPRAQADTSQPEAGPASGTAHTPPAIELLLDDAGCLSCLPLPALRDVASGEALTLRIDTACPDAEALLRQVGQGVEGGMGQWRIGEWRGEAWGQGWGKGKGSGLG
jgi:hypothetical protein